MGKQRFDEDLDVAVRELGGDDADLKLVADADFSGSDFEDAGAGKSDKDLNDEVQKMWDQLNGSQSSAKPTKKVFDSSEQDGAESRQSKQPKQSKDTKESKQPKESKESKQFKESKESKKESKEPKESKKESKESKESKNTKQDKHDKQPKTEAKQPVKQPARQPVKQPTPIVLSKKARLEWEKYIDTLNHPQEKLLIDSQKWDVDEVNAQVPLLPADLVEVLKKKAIECLTAENQLYFKERSGDREFSSSLEFLKSGTFSDQLGTLSILSTESPLHSIRFLENLSGKCDIKNRESACKALEVTKDLLVSHVMLDRRLKWFKDQPLQLGLPVATLMSWAFEDYLKRYFFKLLQVMERLLSDSVENIRLRSLHCVFDFFRQKPEQEANLLRLGMNKLGDPSGKVASRVKRLVMDVLQLHPAMKPIVATTVAEVLGRVSDYRTRYYAVDMLSEFILSNRDPSLANQLIYIYLDLFERLLSESKNNKDERVEKPVANKGKPKKGDRYRQKRGKKGGIKQEKVDDNELEQQQHARLVAKLFTGLNRAFPFSNLDPVVFGKYTDTLYHMSHSPNVGTFIEALSFIFQLSKASPSTSGNRYYRALYESLLDGRLQSSSKLSKYIHLVLKSLAELKRSGEAVQSSAFIKRTLQIACNWSEIGAVASLIHTANLSSVNNQLVESPSSSAEHTEDSYDPKQRDPRYAHAETSKAWELVLLQRHFHPTVVHYANNFLAPESEKVHLDMPDIEHYTVNSFLSKWSYKKPKAKESTRGGSIFQPLSGYTDLTLGVRQEKKLDETPASMQDWKSKSEGQVAPDEQFLYEYFSHRPDRKPKKSAEAETANADDSEAELSDDEVNEAMSQYGPGDLGGNDMTNVDFSDSEEDGDLEAGLDAAFKDSDDDEEDAEKKDLSGEDAGDDSSELDAGSEIEDDDEDAFADFDKELSVQKDDETADTGAKKRKRWSNYPTFLDADAFEDMYAGDENPPKKR